MICGELLHFGGNFTIFGVLERFESSRGASKPQYSYRNNKVFSMWRPGNHQNPIKADFGIILQNFQEFCKKSDFLVIFKKTMGFSGFLGFWGFKSLRPCF